MKMFLSLLGAVLLCTSMFAQVFPEVVSIREIKLKKGTNPVAYSNAIKIMNNGLEKEGEGINLRLWFGDRGERAGELLQSWTFDRKKDRDFYFPVAEGTDEDYANMTALAEKIKAPLSPNDPRVESGMDVYTDYVMIGYDKLENPMVGMLTSVHEIEINEGMEAEFEAFVQSDLHPAFQKEGEGMALYILKGDRGTREGKYIAALCFDTIERRDHYYPKPDTPSEAANELNKKLQPVMEGAAKFLKEGMGTKYTDYLIIL